MRMTMIRILADASFGLFATATLAEPLVSQITDPGVYGWISKFGTLGLCAFMVFQNYRQSDSLGKVIAVKDAQNMELQREVLNAIEKNTQALAALTDGFAKRPCIMAPKQGD